MDGMEWGSLTPQQWRDLRAAWATGTGVESGTVMEVVLELEDALKDLGRRETAHLVFDHAVAVYLHLVAITRAMRAEQSDN